MSPYKFHRFQHGDIIKEEHFRLMADLVPHSMIEAVPQSCNIQQSYNQFTSTTILCHVYSGGKKIIKFQFFLLISPILTIGPNYYFFTNLSQITEHLYPG